MWPKNHKEDWLESLFNETSYSDMGYVNPLVFGLAVYVAPEFGLTIESGDVRSIAGESIRMIVKGKHNNLQGFWDRINELRKDHNFK